MTARPADLTIDVIVDGQRTYLTLTDRQVEGTSFPPYRGSHQHRLTLGHTMSKMVREIGHRAAASSKTSWGRHLAERFRLVARSDEQHWARVTSAVKQLYERGQALTQNFFGDDAIHAQTVMRQVCPLWQAAEPITVNRLPLIEINTDDLAETIPLEYLPLLDKAATPPAKIRNIAELTDALRPFVGFSALIRRIDATARQSQIHELPNIPALPVKFFRNSTLAYSGKELADLERRNQVAVDKWPDDSILRRPDFPCFVAGHLWVHDGEQFDGTTFGRPFQVLHFACHCDTTGEAAYHRLIFGDVRDPATHVSVSQLEQCRQQHYDSRIKPVEHAAHPFVFLNACGTSVIDPTAATSLPQFFLKHGSCAYVGTEAVVPDDLAGLFSEAFYAEFLSGESIGVALHRAKWHLVQMCNNPLGLLYTLYGNPDITVQKPGGVFPQRRVVIEG